MTAIFLTFLFAVVFEEKVKPRGYKIGVLYMKRSQSDETAIYNNVDGSEQFVEFLSLLGAHSLRALRLV